MGVKPESQFISNVHKYLPYFVHCENMHNPYRAGVPDVWYDSPYNDIWVEYKWFQKVPPTFNLVHDNRNGLSALQYQWIMRAHNNGRRVFVVAGAKFGNKPKGLLIQPAYLETDIKRDDFASAVFSCKELATILVRWMELTDEQFQQAKTD